MQEDKELTFDAIDTVKGCLTLFADMLATTRFRKDIMEKSAAGGFTNATDAADYLVKHGVPFRDAHGIIGALVLACEKRGCALDTLPLEEYKAICPAFEEDIYEAISLATCVSKRNTKGAPGPSAMQAEINDDELFLKAIGANVRY
jgi:argininosuccinate lyase